MLQAKILLLQHAENARVYRTSVTKLLGCGIYLSIQREMATIFYSNEVLASLAKIDDNFAPVICR